MKELIDLAKKESIKEDEFPKNSDLFLRNQIKGYIAKTIWQKEDAFYMVINQLDNEFLECMKLFEKADALQKGMIDNK
jgi:hypothetical protein